MRIALDEQYVLAKVGELFLTNEVLANRVRELEDAQREVDDGLRDDENPAE